MILAKFTTSIVTLLLLVSPNYAPQAAQHALVVGINQYPPGTDSLKGAVNDARSIEQALRKIQVQQIQVLLDSKATRASVINAWEQMVKQAQPGDTLIFTYAGHGSQQEDAPPLDEEDGKDETLVLYQGILTDDELTDLFAKAGSYQIVFVADSCHSGGMVIREKSFSASPEICRFTTERTSAEAQIPSLPLTTQGDEKEVLQHVTLISAQQSDNQKVCEITADHQAHGALSYFFAQALEGTADGNENSQLERSELERFLRHQVTSQTNRLQDPRLLPRPDDQPVIMLQGRPSKPAPPMASDEFSVAIRVEGGNPPTGLTNVRLVQDQSFDLRFVMTGTKVAVFNRTGDMATQLSSGEGWQPIINKERLLMALETQLDMRLRPVGMTLREGDRVHRRGDVLHFTISPPQDSQLKALTLFNLTGNGQLQFLYPLEKKQHPLTVADFPYELKPIRVVYPFGGDNLVAILCDHPPKELQKLLVGVNRFLSEPSKLLEKVKKLHQQRCQVKQYAFFTKE